MATRFNTQTGNGEYRLQLETNNEQHFLLMQSVARLCVDIANCDNCCIKMDEERRTRHE